MEMAITLQGDTEFQELFRQIEELSTRFAGVRLIATREDGRDTDKIVDGLTAHGKDFFSSDDAVAELVAEASAAEIEKRMQAAAKKGRPAPGDDALAGSMLRAAIKAYSEAVKDRIESQRVAGGGSPDPLTPEYAAYKERKYGFTSPIGKASGQLLEGLAVGGGAAGKIELIQR